MAAKLLRLFLYCFGYEPNVNLKQVDDILLAIENNQPKYQFLNEAFSGLK